MDTEGKADIQGQDTDNPHDKGYKRIFSVKRNFLDFIKKYVGFGWMAELTENDLELVDKEFITDQFDTYECRWYFITGRGTGRQRAALRR